MIIIPLSWKKINKLLRFRFVFVEIASFIHENKLKNMAETGFFRL